MGGKSSKVPEEQPQQPQQPPPLEAQPSDRQLKRQSTYSKANGDEEQAWLDVMSKQNNQALSYKTLHKKKSTPTLLNANIIFVVGGPGSGKGTHCTRLSVEFNLCHLSVGDLLREEASKGSERGKILDEYMKEGKIVPMEITLDVLRSAIEERKDKAGFLIDGFPRKLDQAREFEEKVAKCKFVLYFECSEEEMVRRLMIRGETSGRIDDNEETIKKRLTTFREASMPVIDLYLTQGKVKSIQSERDVVEVYEDARHVLVANNFPQHDLWKESEESVLLTKIVEVLQEKKKTKITIGDLEAQVEYPRGKRRALLVGLNYELLSFKKNLGGCVKDAVQLKGLLKQHNFETLVITDDNKTSITPTADNILAALKHTIEGCEEGDHVLFYFSGHVGKIFDEDDKKFHEALIATDGPIFDIDLVELLESLPSTVHFTVVVDGCYGSPYSSGERTHFHDAKAGFYLISHAVDAKSKEMPYTAGGAMTNTLITILKENNFVVPLGTLKESIATLLKTLNLALFTSPLGHVSGQYFLDLNPSA